MEVWVTGQPHLLYETVELLFAYVNRIPAVELTQEGPYCLPEAAIQQMLDVACAGISQDDPEIQYDFGKYVLSEDPSALPVLPATWSITPWSPPAETWPQTVRACVRPGKGNEEIGNAWWT